MTLQPLDVILRRLGRELQNKPVVALGEGIPQMVRPLLSAATTVVSLAGNGSSQPVDVAVVESDEISSAGDLPELNGVSVEALEAGTWIVAATHTHEDGEPRLVKSCLKPVAFPGKARLVITELAVIEISEVGLVLKEIAPGVSSDEVKLKTRASLHVADDIRLMEL